MASIRRYVQFLIQDAASGRRADVIFPEEQVRGKRRKTKCLWEMPFLRTGYSGKFKILLLRRMEKRLQIFALEGQPEAIRSGAGTAVW